MMTGEEAAWVRANVITETLVGNLAPTDVCACQYGASGWCTNGGCRKCTGGGTAFPETSITDKTGHVLYLDGVYALVWLADRVCRWWCACSCHRKALRTTPVQPSLFEEVA
jgi:uncharacterized protein DUF6248